LTAPQNALRAPVRNTPGEKQCRNRLQEPAAAQWGRAIKARKLCSAKRLQRSTTCCNGATPEERKREAQHTDSTEEHNPLDVSVWKIRLHHFTLFAFPVFAFLSDFEIDVRSSWTPV
jgi:hypothetical protein